ncbi:MAG: DUF302 domain-containing protein [Paracoccaceae bacterium]|nr:DUF302 domain-containing protein [Paracoccaceae bacterium]
MKYFLTPIAALVFVAMLSAQAQAGAIAPRDGWAVHDTAMGYQDLLASLKSAVKAEGMIVVTQAGPTAAAKKRGIEIPGNRVVGVYRNDYAVRALAASTAAMIEAPIRFYVIENPDGAATLSYKTPSAVFAPYMDEGGAELAAIAEELDAIFAAIAKGATGQ